MRTGSASADGWLVRAICGQGYKKEMSQEWSYAPRAEKRKTGRLTEDKRQEDKGMFSRAITFILLLTNSKRLCS